MRGVDPARRCSGSGATVDRTQGRYQRCPVCGRGGNVSKTGKVAPHHPLPAPDPEPSRGGRPRQYPPEVAAARHAENSRRWNAARLLANQVYAPAARRTDAYRARLRIERDRQDERLGPLPGDAPRHPYAPQTRPSVETPAPAPKPVRGPWIPHDPLWPVPQDPKGHGKPRRFPPEVSKIRNAERSRRANLAVARAARHGMTVEAARAAIDAECGPLPGDEYPVPEPRPIVRHRQRRAPAARSAHRRDVGTVR